MVLPIPSLYFETTMKRFFIPVLAGVLCLGAVSCQKDSVVEVGQDPQQIEVAKTPSINEVAAMLNETAEVVGEEEEVAEKLYYMLESGSDENHICIKLSRGEQEYVSGEIGLIEGIMRKELDFDIVVYGIVPIVGSIDLPHVLNLYLSACLSISDKACKHNLDQANEGIHLTIMGIYKLELRYYIEEETGDRKIDLFMVDPANPDSPVSVSNLLSLFVN